MWPIVKEDPLIRVLSECLWPRRSPPHRARPRRVSRCAGGHALPVAVSPRAEVRTHQYKPSSALHVDGSPSTYPPSYTRHRTIVASKSASLVLM